VTQPRIQRWLRDTEQGSARLLVTDEHRANFENALRRRGWPELPGAHLLWRLARAIQRLGRRELDTSLLIRVLAKS
jgi:hypothetical protein